MTKHTEKFLKNDTYNPGALLDHLTELCKVPNDSQLSKAIGVSAPVICKIRQKKHTLTGDIMLRIWDVTRLDVDQQRQIAGIPMAKKVAQPAESGAQNV